MSTHRNGLECMIRTEQQRERNNAANALLQYWRDRVRGQRPLSARDYDERFCHGERAQRWGVRSVGRSEDT